MTEHDQSEHSGAERRLPTETMEEFLARRAALGAPQNEPPATPDAIRCEGCLYWVFASECRRHAPESAPFPDDPTKRLAVWPSTTAEDGCGDFIDRRKYL